MSTTLPVTIEVDEYCDSFCGAGCAFLDMDRCLLFNSQLERSVERNEDSITVRDTRCFIFDL